MLSVLLVCALSRLLEAGLPNLSKLLDTGKRIGYRQAQGLSADTVTLSSASPCGRTRDAPCFCSLQRRQLKALKTLAAAAVVQNA